MILRTSNGAPFSHGFSGRKDVESMTCHELLMLLRHWTQEVGNNGRGMLGLVERCWVSRWAQVAPFFFLISSQEDMDGEISTPCDVVKKRVRVLCKWLILLDDQSPLSQHMDNWGIHKRFDYSADRGKVVTLVVTKTQQHCPISRSLRTVARRSIQIPIGACLKKCFTRLLESKHFFKLLSLRVSIFSFFASK